MKTTTVYALSSLVLSASIFVHALNTAQALPQTQNISLGSNPLFTLGGTISNTTTTLFTAPNDQMMVITDIILTMNSNSCGSTLELTNSNATTLSMFKLHSYNHLGGYRAAQSQVSSIQHAFNSGISVNPNDSLDISESGSCNVAYTISGYYAHP
jgi:hypothetical protein